MVNKDVYILITNRKSYWLSIGAEFNDLEWPWTPK